MHAVTYEQAAELEGISARAIRKRIRHGNCRKVRTGETHESNGKPVMGVPVEDLSEDAQARYWREIAEETEMNQQAGQERLPSPCPDGSPGSGRPAACTELARTDEADQPHPLIPVTPDGVPDEAAMEVQAPQHLATYRRRMRAVALAQERVENADYGELGAAWREVANIVGKSARTIRRWCNDLEEYGPVALVPERGKDRGESRVIDGELDRKIREFWLQQDRPSVTQVWWDVVKPHCEGAGQIPHISTVRRHIKRSVKPLEEAVFRYGERAYKVHHQPKVRRDLDKISVNECWVADHRKLDVFVLKDGTAIRPWLTAIVDWKSAAMVSWRICERPGADTVCHALRTALLQVGPADYFYRDNGKEFVAKRLGGKPDRLKKASADDLEAADRWPAGMPGEVLEASVWDLLGIQMITAIPYSSWSKIIEPLFGAYAKRYENRIPGWCGSDAKERPERLQRDIDQGNLLTWDQFGEAFARLMQDYHTSRPVGDRDKPPLAYYAGYEARIPSEQTVDMLLQDQRRAKVYPDGITLEYRGEKHLFWCSDLALWSGARLDLRWDPARPADGLVAYLPTGERLAVPLAEKAHPLEYGEVNIERRRAAKQQREHLAAVRDEISGACSVEELDRFGMRRMVVARKEAEANEMGGDGPKRKQQDLPAADAEAQRQAEARERGEDVEPADERDPYGEVADRYGRLRKKLA